MTTEPDTDRAPGRAGGRRAMVAATAGGVLAAAIVLAVSLALLGPPGGGRDRSTPAATASYTIPPAVEVQQIHDTLDDIANRCTPNAGADAQAHLNGDVDVILAFARRYPNAEFPIEDETGHTLSLLVATRDDLSHCASAAAARVNAALPPQFRQPPSGPASRTG